MQVVVKLWSGLACLEHYANYGFQHVFSAKLFCTESVDESLKGNIDCWNVLKCGENEFVFYFQSLKRFSVF